jgi:hypothetical protein
MLYIAVKYIEASSVDGARRKEKQTPVHELYLSQKWVDARLLDTFDKNKQKIGYEMSTKK